MTADIAGGTRRNGWTIALWAAQILLAIMYLMAGGMKLTQPMAGLAAMGMGYATTLPEAFVRFVGTMEILGALGMILPSATRILPVLTPLAAAGLSLVQVSAIVLHDGARLVVAGVAGTDQMAGKARIEGGNCCIDRAHSRLVQWSSPPCRSATRPRGANG